MGDTKRVTESGREFEESQEKTVREAGGEQSVMDLEETELQRDC